MPEEFLQQFHRVIGKGRQDVLTPPGWPQWRTTFHITTSAWWCVQAWKMPPSWHWTDTLEVIGSKRSYALNWCKLNDDHKSMPMIMSACDWLQNEWPRMTLSGNFMPKSVFVPAVLDSEGLNFKDNFAKTNNHRPTTLAEKCRPITTVLAI